MEAEEPPVRWAEHKVCQQTERVKKTEDNDEEKQAEWTKLSLQNNQMFC